jgi:hypothetical protein
MPLGLLESLMRRKLLFLSLLLVAMATPPPSQAQQACYVCEYCRDGTCYGCVQVVCGQ